MNQPKEAMKQAFKFGISWPINLDRIIAFFTKNRPWSHWYKKGGTISFGFGCEEAEILYFEWIKHHRICKTLPYISMLDHPLGMFSEDICSLFQTIGTGKKSYHGLQCFLRDPGFLEKKYPGVTNVVIAFLKTKGVKV